MPSISKKQNNRSNGQGNRNHGANKNNNKNVFFNNNNNGNNSPGNNSGSNNKNNKNNGNRNGNNSVANNNRNAPILVNGKNKNYSNNAVQFVGVCSNCGKTNHDDTTCRSACGNCGVKGHQRTQCTISVQNGNTNHNHNHNHTALQGYNDDLYCQYCNMRYHRTMDCTNAVKMSLFNLSNLNCAKCHCQGHEANTCANPIPWTRSQDTSALLPMSSAVVPLVKRPADAYCKYCNICDVPFHNTETCKNHTTVLAWMQSRIQCSGCGHQGHTFTDPQSGEIICKHPDPGVDVTEIAVPIGMIGLMDNIVVSTAEAAHYNWNAEPIQKMVLENYHNKGCHYIALPRMAELTSKNFRAHCAACHCAALVIGEDQDVVMGCGDADTFNTVPGKMCLEMPCDHWGWEAFAGPIERNIYWKKSW